MTVGRWLFLTGWVALAAVLTLALPSTDPVLVVLSSLGLGAALVLLAVATTHTVSSLSRVLRR